MRTLSLHATGIRLVAMLCCFFLLAGCFGSNDSDSSANSGQQLGNRDQSPGKPDHPRPGPPTDNTDENLPLNRYSFANGCYRLGTGEQWVRANPGSNSYDLTASAAQAAAFYLRPTELGAYLLMSDFQRSPGEIGRMNLLGITDPAGDLLDELGNFIGEAGYLVSGAGDTVNLVLDPILPLGNLLRSAGETIGLLGNRVSATVVYPQLGMSFSPNDLAVWKLNPAGDDRFQLQSRVTSQLLAATHEGLALVGPAEAGRHSQFTLTPAEDCAQYPEAELNATVMDERGPAIYLHEVERFQGIAGIDEQAVFGFVDTHSHISAYEFIGGRVNYGAPFHRFGITHALKDCSANHGPWGATGFVNWVTAGGAHDTQGWPTFNDWPKNNELMHHQSYYRWLERTHLAGMKILVNHLVHNEILCRINPQKQNDCDPIEAIDLQIRRMYEMQDYIDAQHGGPGAGWFRIVTSPAEAREVIGEGKLAVILGIEMSRLMRCSEFQDVAQCTREEIVERLDHLYRLGVRNIFPVHKFDNAFGGHLPDLSSGVGIGAVLYGGNLLATGHPVEFEECPEGSEYTGSEPDQNASLQPLGLIDQMLFQLDYVGDRFPETPEELAALDPRRGTDHLCNRRGLTDLGDFLIQELMRRGIMIETDHISRKAAARILDITKPHGYPVINSHGGWGGTEALRDRIAAQGGVTASFGGTRDGWVRELTRDGNRPRPADYKVGPFGGAGFASDVNGIANLAGNSGTAEDDARLYPFTSIDGRVQFGKQRTGDREFGLYDGRGVAHYGLYADQIADMVLHSNAPKAQVEDAVNQLFTSAEAYLRMWERIEAAMR
ncbi:MAG: membrane dipeptidase [Marinobacter sp.]|nr:membrane dipeptidase [Marinobacter sp.]